MLDMDVTHVSLMLLDSFCVRVSLSPTQIPPRALAQPASSKLHTPGRRSDICLKQFEVLAQEKHVFKVITCCMFRHISQ